MANMSKIKIGTNVYDVKDTTARSTADSADTKADQAIVDSSNALSRANSAYTLGTNANTKIDGASITGTYTSSTEILELSIELGSVTNE